MNLENASLDDIQDKLQEIEQIRNHLKGQEDAIQEEIERRYEETAKIAFAESGKETGQITVPLEGRYSLKVQVGKTVTWDSDKLLEATQKMPWATVQTLFKIKVTMPEAKFNALVDQDLIAAVTPARTTKIKPIDVKLLKGTNDSAS